MAEEERAKPLARRVGVDAAKSYMDKCDRWGALRVCLVDGDGSMRTYPAHAVGQLRDEGRCSDGAVVVYVFTGDGAGEEG